MWVGTLGASSGALGQVKRAEIVNDEILYENVPVYRFDSGT